MLLICLTTGTGSAAEALTPGVVWVDMTRANPKYRRRDFEKALRLRLPGWDVREAPPRDQGPICRGTRFRDASVLLWSDGGHTRLEVVGCADGSTRLEETIDDGAPTEDALRQAAALVRMALAAQPEKAPPPGPQKTAEPLPRGHFDRTRVMATLGLAPGLTAAPTAGRVVFTGSVDIGVLFINDIWVAFGADLSTSYAGKAVKKNQTPSEGTEVGVTDFGFWLGLSYRFDLGERWYIDAGLAGRYTHSAVRDRSEDKYEVTEETPSARGSVVGIARAGVMLTRFLAVFIALEPAVSFGRRIYKVRGEEAVNLGLATIGAGLGGVFFF
jgi:hypothetical protein